MKKTLNFFLLFIVISVYGQEKPTFFGGFESNAQWYLNDKALKVGQPDSPVRSNNYLFLNSKLPVDIPIGLVSVIVGLTVYPEPALV